MQNRTPKAPGPPHTSCMRFSEIFSQNLHVNWTFSSELSLRFQREREMEIRPSSLLPILPFFDTPAHHSDCPSVARGWMDTEKLSAQSDFSGGSVQEEKKELKKIHSFFSFYFIYISYLIFSLSLIPPHIL